MEADKATLKELEKDLEDVKLVHLTLVDINGVCRGKILPARNVMECVTNGQALFSGGLVLGPRTQVAGVPDEFEATGFGNGVLKLDVASFYKIPTVEKDSKKKTTKRAEIYGEMRWNLHTPIEADPRRMAKEQLRLLEQNWQLSFFAAFEFEFYMVHEKTMQYSFEGMDCISQKLHDDFAEFLLTLEEHLHGLGVHVEAMHTEYGHGQWEISVKPQFGIMAADMGMRLKSGVKRVAKLYGFSATFMSKPFPYATASGFHMNHSLWNRKKKNAIYDESKVDRVSEIGRYWVGGLLKHAHALTAMSNPTVNCYRRLHSPFCPDKADWGLENRSVTINIKTGTDNGTRYIENRLPSAACNLYIAIAATIAAGMDGLKNKIDIPAQSEGTKLPSTLTEGLEALDKDNTLKELLGETFVRWFTLLKTKVDIADLKESDITKEDEAMFKAEREMYFEYL